MWVFGLSLITVVAAVWLMTTLRKDQKSLRRADTAAKEQAIGPTSHSMTPDQIIARIAEERHLFPALRDGCETQLVWQGSKGKGSQVVVYLHGFSASPHEISPVPEAIARAIGAHYYAPRLHGHGMGSAELGNATAENWLADVWDAWSVATSMADQVIIMASSTGATLATSLLRSLEVKASVQAVIFFSPNYGIKRAQSRLLNWTFGVQIMRWFSGPEWAWQPTDAVQARIWTYRYPVKVLHQVQRLVQWTIQSPIVDMHVPLCVVQCRIDKTVSAEKAADFLTGWKGPILWLYLSPKEGTNNHVLVGDATRPENNDATIETLVDFIQKNR